MQTPDTFYFFLAVISLLFAAFIGVIALRAAMRPGAVEVGGWALRGTGVRLRAIAYTTLAEGIRMRILWFVGVLIVGALALAFQASGDGTIKGRVQAILEYVLGLAALGMALVTVILSTWSLSREIAGRQIWNTVSKPVPRWEIVIGKWIGVAVLNIVAMAIATAAAYGGVRYQLWRFHSLMHHQLVAAGGLTPQQATKCLDAVNNVKGAGGQGMDSPIIPAIADALGWGNEQVAELLLKLPELTRADLRRLDELRRQVLVARSSLRPVERDVTEVVDQKLAQIKEKNELPTLMTEKQARDELRKIEQLKERVVPPGTGRRWTLRGAPPAAADDFLLSVRFKIEGFSNTFVSRDGLTLEEETILAGWVIGDPQSESVYYWPDPISPQKMNTYVEFEVPRQVVKSDGTLQVEFRNLDPRSVTAVFSAKNGLEILYRTGSFEGNLLRAALLLTLPLLMLGAVGIFFSTYCTFPVAALVTFVLCVTSLGSSFWYESIGLDEGVFPEYPSHFDYVRRATGLAIMHAVQWSGAAPTSLLIEGRQIGWGPLLRDLGITIGIKTTAALGLAVMILRRKELAAIIV